MAQTIPAFVINLTRRPDRLERMAAHLRDRGIAFTAIAACDAQTVPPDRLDCVIPEGGPLGRLGPGDRACTVSHTLAWQAFLETAGASHALILEDDVWLAEDIAATLASATWLPHAAGPVKLEKFGAGGSKLLLGAKTGETPTGRALHPMLSRHVGGGAYILSRRMAEAALAERGRIRVPVDHFLFNANVSAFSRRARPLLVNPAMATQRAWAYNSDIAKHGKAARPTGLAMGWRRLKRGWYEINRMPQQLAALATGHGQIQTVAFSDTPPSISS
ncbi:MAG: glycosyltransferase family 25 protein [Pseudomonadota bacterium]